MSGLLYATQDSPYAGPAEHDMDKIASRMGVDRATAETFLADLQALNAKYEQQAEPIRQQLRSGVSGARSLDDARLQEGQQGGVAQLEQQIDKTINAQLSKAYQQEFFALSGQHGVMPIQESGDKVYWFNPGAPRGIDPYEGQAQLSKGAYTFAQDERFKDEGEKMAMGLFKAAILASMTWALGGAGGALFAGGATAGGAAAGGAAAAGAAAAGGAASFAGQVGGATLGSALAQKTTTGEVDWGDALVGGVTNVAAGRLTKAAGGTLGGAWDQSGTVQNTLLAAGSNAAMNYATQGLLGRGNSGSEAAPPEASSATNSAAPQPMPTPGDNMNFSLSSSGQSNDVTSPGQYNGVFGQPPRAPQQMRQNVGMSSPASDSTRQEYLDLVNETVRAGQKTPEQDKRLRQLRQAVLRMTPLNIGQPRPQSGIPRG